MLQCKLAGFPSILPRLHLHTLDNMKLLEIDLSYQAWKYKNSDATRNQRESTLASGRMCEVGEIVEDKCFGTCVWGASRRSRFKITNIYSNYYTIIEIIFFCGFQKILNYID